MKFLITLFIYSIGLLAQDSSYKPETAWEKIESGVYKIDFKNDSGGLYMPVLTDKKTTIYIMRDFSQMMKFSDSPFLKSKNSNSCENEDIVSSNDACHILEKSPISYEKEQLKKCLVQIKKMIAKNNTPLKQKKTIQNLYKLPKYQQDFAAAIFTGYGEGRSESDKEIALIFKTLANRVRYAKTKSCTNANMLDVAIQRFQFSMWNKKDPNWKKSISVKNEEKSEAKQQDRMIDVYIKFKNNKYKFEPQKVIDKIYHYRTKSIPKAPSWGKTSKAEKIVKVDGSNLGASNSKAKNAHYFFKSVAWSFKYHPDRKKLNGEDKCY